jgi:hypothetical protein
VKTGAKMPNTTSSPIASATSTPNATAVMLLIMKLFYQAPPKTCVKQATTQGLVRRRMGPDKLAGCF